jgi:hypothetical protein
MLTEDWTGNLYCEIQLDWDYAGRTVDISMPGYIKKKLQVNGHIMPRKIQGCPYAPEPKIFGTEAQASFHQDYMPKLDEEGIKRVQQIVGSILYYAQAVDMTVLMVLSTIAVNQTSVKKNNGEMHAIIRLPCPQRGRKSMFPCVGHYIKHSFRCVILVRGKSKEQGVWEFFSVDRCPKMGNRYN